MARRQFVPITVQMPKDEMPALKARLREINIIRQEKKLRKFGDSGYLRNLFEKDVGIIKDEEE